MTKARVEDRPLTLNRSERPNRVPINGLRDKLSIKGQEPGFHYCIVNDYNVEIYTQAGYEFVTHDAVIGERHVNAAAQEGGKLSLPVGNGVTGFVMRIPQEWYDEDRAEEQKQLDDNEKSLYSRLNSKEDGRYGRVTIEQSKPLAR